MPKSPPDAGQSSANSVACSNLSRYQADGLLPFMIACYQLLAQPSFEPKRRWQYVQRLRQGYTQYQHRFTERHLEQLQQLFMRLSDWPSVLQMLEQKWSLADQPCIDLYCDLLDLYCHTGKSHTANQWLLETPGWLKSPACKNGHRKRIEAASALLKRQHLHNRLPIESQPLSLCPLTSSHQLDFQWQYFDRNIAELCCLPHLTNEADWQRWLQEQHRIGGRTTWGIFHHTLGFIGVVSLTLLNGIGFFYYWLGKDFQQRGLGPKAVTQLLQYASDHWGLQRCYAKVFQHNMPSIQALEKMQFQRLSLTAGRPYDDELYYQWHSPLSPNAHTDTDQAKQEFETIMLKMGIAIHFMTNKENV